jgi:hypothetical protein
MAGYGAEPTLERPSDDACERRFVAEPGPKMHGRRRSPLVVREAPTKVRSYRHFQIESLVHLVHLVMIDERLYFDDLAVSEAAVAQSLGHDPVNGDDLIGSHYFVPQPVFTELETLDTKRRGRMPSIPGPTQTQ